jgi:hypothetical protein
MKKILVLFAIATATILTSCGNGNGSAKETVDSTEVSVDSVKVDSAAVEAAPAASAVEGENVEVSKELEEVK